MCMTYLNFTPRCCQAHDTLRSVDPTADICNVLEFLRDELKIQTYVHVDAAFGGFVLPFLEPDLEFGFQNKLVDSMVVDAHKTGFVPYSAGVFMCRKGWLRYTTIEAKYIPGHSTTVCGSRSGAIAAACWALTELRGREEFREKLQECMTNLGYLQKRLLQLNNDGQEHVKLYPARMNIQAVWVDDEIMSIMIPKNPKDISDQYLCSRFCVPSDIFPRDLTNPDCFDGLKADKITIFRFVVMPHLSKQKIDQFMDELMAHMIQHIP